MNIVKLIKKRINYWLHFLKYGTKLSDEQFPLPDIEFKILIFNIKTLNYGKKLHNDGEIWDIAVDEFKKIRNEDEYLITDYLSCTPELKNNPKRLAAIEVKILEHITGGACLKGSTENLIKEYLDSHQDIVIEEDYKWLGTIYINFVSILDTCHMYAQKSHTAPTDTLVRGLIRHYLGHERQHARQSLECTLAFRGENDSSKFGFIEYSNIPSEILANMAGYVYMTSFEDVQDIVKPS